MTGMMKKTLLFLCLALMLLACSAVPAQAENIPELGLEEALIKAQEFNEWMQQRSDEEIAAEMGISKWDVLSPYGTEAPPEPLITVSENDTWEDLIARLWRSMKRMRTASASAITTAAWGRSIISMLTGIWCRRVCSRFL